MGKYAGMKVTIMGLGINGGGLESARYLAQNGAECTITDMKDQQALASSIETLEALSAPHAPFRFVLGRHDIKDFSDADMVIKNPAVRPDSPYLTAARRIETDISLFLSSSPARLIAVTGSKGKSGTASAVYWALSKAAAERQRNKELRDEGSPPCGRAFLGGNISVSPLSFLDELTQADDVVLELSSWQLGDLKDRGLLKPRTAILTSIMSDHQDRYNGMEAYVNDKRLIYHDQNKEDATIACVDDHWGISFLKETPGRPLPYSQQPMPPENIQTGAWLDPHSGAGIIFWNGTIIEAVPPKLLIPGRHNKKNCLAAALALTDLNIPDSLIRESLAAFPGIEHRLEFFRETEGIRFYNDSASTIPEAATAAIEACTAAHHSPNALLILVTGGTDKNLDFSPLAAAIQSAKTAAADTAAGNTAAGDTAAGNTAAASALEIILLSGTGSDKLSILLERAGITFSGPFDNIDKAAQTAQELAAQTIRRTGGNTEITVVLSPGCTSFGMFKNEFDRGRQWKEAVGRL